MTGAVRFLLGRADTGKSAQIVETLRQCALENRRGVLIVPEQYTFESERALCRALDGLLGVQVLSFERLSERVLSLCGRHKPYLSQQGCRMVTRRAIEKRRADLLAFGGVAEQRGFAEQLQALFGECKRACITPEALQSVVQKLPCETPLYDKLHDIALLYEETQTYLSSRYLDADDAFFEAMRLLPESFIAGAEICIDGLEKPNKQLYGMLEAIIACAGRVTVALRVCDEADADAPLFLPERRVYEEIRRIALRLGAQVSELALTTQGTGCAPAIRHMERSLFAYPEAAYPAAADEVTLYGASSRRAESEALAWHIQSRARQGVRYRDMAVIVSDMGTYASLIRRAFKRRSIPLFLDCKRALIGHAAADALLSAVRFVSCGYAPADLLQYVKSGYAGLEESDVDALSLYLLRTGLRGGALTKPFMHAKAPEAAERARQAAMEQLLPLADGLKNTTVEAQARALYAFMQSIRLGEALTRRAEALQAAGRAAEAEEHAQVWNEIVTLLEQTAAILGDVRMGRRGFLALMEEGLNAVSIGVIPGTTDQVLVGDLSRTKSRGVSALFVVGANEGLLPRTRTDDGLINDDELDALAAAGMELRARSSDWIDSDELDLYTALSKARRSLYISYAFGDSTGELSLSPLVARLNRILPACRQESDLCEGDALPDCQAEALTALSRDLGAYQFSGVCRPRLPALWAHFTERTETRAFAFRLMEASVGRYAGATLGGERARALYGTTVPMNASRIETFSACPFKHFIRYGLRAAETKTFTERASDLGAFYHTALERFVSAVNARKLDWRTLAEEAALSLLDELLPQVVAEHNDGIFLTNDRLRATLFLLIDVVKQSALAVLKQIQAGSFTPVGAELRFGEGCAFPPIRLPAKDGGTALISGVVDRIDQARVDGRDFLRVIDYKTGGRRFSFAGVVSGLTVQLPIYLAAMRGVNEQAGLYYMPIAAPRISDAESDIEASLAEAFLLQGLTLSEPKVVLASDHRIEEGACVLGGVKRSRDGAFIGGVATKSELELLIKAAIHRAEIAFERMLEGDCAASPVSLTRASDACKYCDYGSVCRFDAARPGCGVRLVSRCTQADFFALMKGGAQDALDE